MSENNSVIDMFGFQDWRGKDEGQDKEHIECMLDYLRNNHSDWNANQMRAFLYAVIMEIGKRARI